MNTHESYVSLETAKMLKEVGFDWECKTYYDTSIYLDETIIEDELRDYNFINGGIRFSAPTLAVAQRWLRKVKGYNVLVCHDFKWNKHAWWILQDNELLCHNTQLFDTYEQALEAGIQECLTILLEE